MHPSSRRFALVALIFCAMTSSVAYEQRPAQQRPVSALRLGRSAENSQTTWSEGAGALRGAETKGQSLTAALTAARFALKWQEHGPSGEDGDGYLGISHDQNINAWFGQDGVTVLPTAADQVRAGAWRTQLRLKAYGYGQQLQPAPPITARTVKGNRVEYERADVADPRSGGIAVVDWYENQAAGIEQGFTVKARPVRGGDVAAREPLRLVMEVAGTLRAQVRDGDREIELVDDDGKRALTYTKLVAIDAHGKELAAQMQTDAAG